MHIQNDVYSTSIHTYIHTQNSPVALYTHLFRFKVSFEAPLEGIWGDPGGTLGGPCGDPGGTLGELWGDPKGTLGGLWRGADPGAAREGPGGSPTAPRPILKAPPPLHGPKKLQRRQI